MFPQGPSRLGAVWLPWFVRLMAARLWFGCCPASKGCGVIYISLFPDPHHQLISNPHHHRLGTPGCWVLTNSSSCSLKSKFRRLILHTRASRIFYPTQGLPGDSTTYKGIQGVYRKDRQCRSSPAANINHKSGKRVSRLRLPRIPMQMAVDPHLLRVSIRPRSTTRQEELEAEEQEEQVSMTCSRIRSWRGGCLTA